MGTPRYLRVYLMSMICSVAALAATNSDPYVAVSTVACFLEYQSVGVWLQKWRHAVRDAPVFFNLYVRPSSSIPVVLTTTWPQAVSTTMTTAMSSESEFMSDNISANTTHANNTTIVNPTKASKFILKFQFTPKNNKNTTDVAYSHYTILQNICHHFPEITIYDNHGRTIDHFPHIKSYAACLCHFNLHHIRENSLKNWPLMYLVFHSILSSVPLREIRRHYEIEAPLNKSTTRVTLHRWKEDETDIAHLGFFINVDLINNPREAFQASIRTNLCKANNIKEHEIPKFQC